VSEILVRLCPCGTVPPAADDAFCSHCGKGLDLAERVPLEKVVANCRNAAADVATETVTALTRLTAQADQCRRAAEDEGATLNGKEPLNALQRHLLLENARGRERVVASVRTYVATLDGVTVRP
jgi:hypothetical protein